MKIIRKSPSKNGRFLGWFLLFLLFVLVVFILISDSFSQPIQSQLNDLLRQFQPNADLPTLTIDMDFEYYNQILAQRQEALDTGVFIGGNADFVPADINFDGEIIPVLIRLQQGPANHLGPDDKWNFDLRLDEEQPLRQMTRAQLIDPADNNWLNEWAYQHALADAGLLAVPYTFVELIFNGDNRGIYALQGGFDTQLPVIQGREPGVIVEFDPTLIWQNIAYFGGDSSAAIADPITNLSTSGIQFLEVDTFQDAVIAQDDALSAQKEEAIEKLRAFQRGEVAAETIFDIKAYAQFLAISDLWGAVDSSNLLNLRFYFDAESGKLHPIGFNGNPQLENGRVAIDAATFGDPTLQAATIEAMQTVSDPAYLADLETNLSDEWAHWQNAVNSEIDNTSPWESLAKQQTNMARSLNPQQPIFATYVAAEASPTAVLQLDITNVVNFPVEIIGIDFGADTKMPGNMDWVIAGEENLLVDHENALILKPFSDNNTLVRLEIPLTDIYAVNPDDITLNANDIQIESRILGTDGLAKTAVRPGFSENP